MCWTTLNYSIDRLNLGLRWTMSISFSRTEVFPKLTKLGDHSDILPKSLKPIRKSTDHHLNLFKTSFHRLPGSIPIWWTMNWYLATQLCLQRRTTRKNDVVDKSVKETKRLDQYQWQSLLDTAQRMADEDPLMERNLFLIASMKTLFLRI